MHYAVMDFTSPETEYLDCKSGREECRPCQNRYTTMPYGWERVTLNLYLHNTFHSKKNLKIEPNLKYEEH